MRGPTAVAVIGAAAHLICRFTFVAEGRFFASEDDPYRAYTAFLLKDDPSRLVSRMWVLGFEACHALFQMLGVPARWAGICVNSLALFALLLGLVHIMRRLAPDRTSLHWCATALLLASPMTITLAHSSLSDLLATALIVWGVEGFLAYAMNGGLAGVARASLMLGLATWVRYEPWLPAMLLVPAVAFLAWRVPERRRLAALAIAALAWLGPLAWLGAQQARFGDPFHFYAQIVQTVETASGGPNRLAVIAAHLESAILWFPQLVAFALLAAFYGRGVLSFKAASFFSATLLLGVAFQLIGGHPHATFPARLSYGIEIALLPWAAVGLDWCLRNRLRTLGAVGALLISLTALRPAAMQDRESVAFGLSLLRDDLPSRADAKLLVERPLQRPPFGWASVGVLWGHWSQTVWVTPQRGGWTVVEATDVRAPLNLSEEGFRDWLSQTSVLGAWTRSTRARDLLTTRWPCADLTPYGEHELLLWRSCPGDPSIPPPPTTADPLPIDSPRNPR